MLTLLTLGSLSDKIGRRQMMVPGLLFIIAGAVMFMLASDIYGLGAARVLTGIGTGIVTGASSAALVELEPNDNWTRAATLSALFFTLGAFAGPTVSSLMLGLGDGSSLAARACRISRPHLAHTSPRSRLCLPVSPAMLQLQLVLRQF